MQENSHKVWNLKAEGYGVCPGNSIGYPHGRQFGRKWRVIHPNGGRKPRFTAVWATVWAGMEENSPER